MRLKLIPVLLVSIILLIASFTYSKCLAATREKLAESKNECMTCEESKKSNLKNENNKVLIVYEPDLVTTEVAVENVRKKIGADLFKVEEDLFESEVEKNYFNNKSEANSENKTDKEKNINNDLPDIASYDLIVIVSPILWKDSLSIPVMSFLAKTDFDGKEVALISVSEEDDEEVFNEFNKQVQGATILKGINLKNIGKTNEADIDKTINTWIEQLNI